jgi:transposase-like protein
MFLSCCQALISFDSSLISPILRSKHCFERAESSISAIFSQLREMAFETKVFDRYSRVEKALINAVIESYLQGVSTRRIKDIVSRLGIEDLSASSVSRISKELDKRVEEFLKRPIEHAVPYIFVDAR